MPNSASDIWKERISNILNRFDGYDRLDTPEVYLYICTLVITRFLPVIAATYLQIEPKISLCFQTFQDPQN